MLLYIFVEIMISFFVVYDTYEVYKKKHLLEMEIFCSFMNVF